LTLKEKENVTRITWTLDGPLIDRQTRPAVKWAALFLATGALVLFGTLSVAAEKPIDIRMVTLVPLGTSPHVSLLKMGEKWQKASGGRVKLSIIASYRAGGEAAIVDKMGVGGVDAALMTFVGLSKVDLSVNALASIPMVYNSLEEVDYVTEKIEPDLARRLEQKGYVILFWADIGWVHHFSVQPLSLPDDLKRMKVFAWAGDAEQLQIMKDWGTTPVALEPADILPGLSTGMINEVASTPFSANAGQFATVTKHMLRINWAPLVGGAVIRKQTWDRVPAEMRSELLKIAAEAGREIKASGRKESDDAIEAMKKKQGLKVTVPTPQQVEAWRQATRMVYPKIRGKLVSAEMFDKVEGLLAEYRKK
jgi:TRAP-type transport system periplasmic protein